MKSLTFLLSLCPLAYIIFQVYLLQTGAPHQLGADPAKAIVLYQGGWAIKFLLLTMLVTPLRQLTGWGDLLRIRRMLGLFTFFYASLHLASYLVFLLELDFVNLWADVLKRPYITVGFSAFLLLVPLALTSNGFMIRRLGKRWRMLHRVIYLIAILVVIHLVWLAKSSYLEAFIYGALVFLLLFLRVFPPSFRLFQRGLKAPS
jgi:sulfoxide reductase heme-binding subunit YedZ